MRGGQWRARHLLLEQSVRHDVGNLSTLGLPFSERQSNYTAISSSAEGDSMVSGTLMLAMSNMEEELIPPAIALAHRIQGEDDYDFVVTFSSV
jgi:hypothetical protein